jgi:hypothetical protein
LGKWYYEGEGKDCFSQLQGYRQIESPHKDVHTHGRLAVECFYADKLEDAVVHLEQMEQASSSVLQYLEVLAEQGDNTSCKV